MPLTAEAMIADVPEKDKHGAMGNEVPGKFGMSGDQPIPNAFIQ